jgi:hypothetical protein
MERLEPLAEHGDDFEKFYWPKFIRDEFPEYAEFWRKFVQPQREGPESVWFKQGSPSEAPSVANRVIVAQLHYSTFMHLVNVYEIKHSPVSFVAGSNSVSEVARLIGTFSDAIVSLSSATDTADELLERVLLETRYKPWSEWESMKARKKRRNPDPLPTLHNYRNRLVHGPLIPQRVVRLVDEADGVRKLRSIELSFPKFEKLSETIDWRKFQHGEVIETDFALARVLVGEAWTMVLDYLRSEWTSNLLSLLPD